MTVCRRVCFVAPEEGAMRASVPVAQFVFTHPPCMDDVAQRVLSHLLNDCADVYTRAVLRERVERLIALASVRWLAPAAEEDLLACRAVHLSEKHHLATEVSCICPCLVANCPLHL
eukprot:COSAG02_NODE_3896_length_6071_cov_8.989953_2_plen_116_part_00